MGVTKEKYIALAVAVIMAGGFLFRVWDLGGQSLWIDEAYTLNGAKAVLRHGYPLLESGEFYPNNILQVYITAATLKSSLFDPFYPWVARLPAVILGTLLIFAVYWLARAIFRSTGASLLSAFVTAFSYWEIAWSRQIRGYAGCMLLIVIAFIFLWQFLASRKISKLAWAFVSTLIAALFHFAALSLLPVLIACGGALLWTPKNTHLLGKKTLWGLGAVFILEFILIAIFYKGGLIDIGRIFSSIESLFWLGTLTGVAIGLTGNGSRNRTAFLSLSLLVMAAATILFAPMLHTRYIFPLIPLVIILISGGTADIGKFISQLTKPARFTIAFIALLFCSTSIQWIPQTSYILEDDSPRPDFAGAYSRIRELKKDGDIIISTRPVLHEIYLGEKGLWLALSRSNLNLFQSNRSADIEYYIGAPIINDAEELKEIMMKNHGFIVVDGLTRFYLWDKMSLIEENPAVKLVYESRIYNGYIEHMMWLYQF